MTYSKIGITGSISDRKAIAELLLQNGYQWAAYETDDWENCPILITGFNKPNGLGNVSKDIINSDWKILKVPEDILEIHSFIKIQDYGIY